MGKAAENEKIKLKAAYANSLSVALVAGGALLPTLALYQRSYEFAAKPLETAPIWVAVLVASVIALIGGRRWHNHALRMLDKIED